MDTLICVGLMRTDGGTESCFKPNKSLYDAAVKRNAGGVGLCCFKSPLNGNRNV